MDTFIMADLIFKKIIVASTGALKKARSVILLFALNFFSVFSSFANNDADLNPRDHQGGYDEVLSETTSNEHKKTVENLPAYVNHVDENEYTAFMRAVEQGKDSIVDDLLLGMGVDVVNRVDKKGRTALMIAVEKG